MNRNDICLSAYFFVYQKPSNLFGFPIKIADADKEVFKEVLVSIDF